MASDRRSGQNRNPTEMLRLLLRLGVEQAFLLEFPGVVRILPRPIDFIIALRGSAGGSEGGARPAKWLLTD